MCLGIHKIRPKRIKKIAFQWKRRLAGSTCHYSICQNLKVWATEETEGEDTENERRKEVATERVQGVWRCSIGWKKTQDVEQQGEFERVRKSSVEGHKANKIHLLPLTRRKEIASAYLCASEPWFTCHSFRCCGKSRGSCCSHRATLGTDPASVTYQEAALAANRSTPNVT